MADKNLLSFSKMIADKLLREFEQKKYLEETTTYLLLLKEYRTTDTGNKYLLKSEWFDVSCEIEQTEKELIHFITINI